MPAKQRSPAPSKERDSARTPRVRDGVSDASGRFLLRLDPGFHATLREAAGAADVSLNEYCARKLAAPLGGLVASADAIAVVRHAAASFGADLTALVAFGSWARGEESDSSDVDVLVVVDERIALERDLYRRWDRDAIEVEGRAVDVHFAHLPDPDRFSPSVWGEVAIDGVILFERNLELSRRLAEVRRRIVAGDVVRRLASGGQPYWVDLRQPLAVAPAKTRP